MHAQDARNAGVVVLARSRVRRRQVYFTRHGRPFSSRAIMGRLVSSPEEGRRLCGGMINFNKFKNYCRSSHFFSLGMLMIPSPRSSFAFACLLAVSSDSLSGHAWTPLPRILSLTERNLRNFSPVPILSFPSSLETELSNNATEATTGHHRGDSETTRNSIMVQQKSS